MLGTLNPGEEAQLRQTIEMFEVITQSQPQDYQSLEILKEAYLKLEMHKEVIITAKRIAQAYVQLGQLSSAILEYETILQRQPDDKDALAAMAQIENKANNLTSLPPPEMESPNKSSGQTVMMKKGTGGKGAVPADVDDGRSMMLKIFVEGKMITTGDFDICWPAANLNVVPGKAVEPFVHMLAEKQIVPLDKSLKLLSDRSRLAYIPLERYDLDIDQARSFPKDLCRRWCVLPFDKMSKSVMIATANPFNKQAMVDMEAATKLKIIWYLASPTDLLKVLSKVFR